MKSRIVGSCLAVAWSVGGCSNAPPPPPVKDVEFSQSMSTARAAYDRGQLEQAEILFARALTRAEARDDATDIADAAYNLAACHMELGLPDQAVDELETARLELARVGGRTTDIRLLRAKAALAATVAAKQEPPATRLAGTDETDQVARSPAVNPRALVEEILAAKDTTPGEKVQAQVLIGTMELGAGNAAAAAQRAQAARQAVGQVSASARSTLEAGVLELEARLAEEAKNWPAAAQKYDAQADADRQARLFTQMGRALAAAGRAYEHANDSANAADRLYRAARTASAAGDRKTALPLARDALLRARESNSIDLLWQSEHLAADLSSAESRAESRPAGP